MNQYIILFGLILCFTSCEMPEQKSVKAFEQDLDKPRYFRASLDKLTDIIVHDIFSPPVASRVYVYPCIAAYQVLQSQNSDLKNLAGQLRGLRDTPQPKDTAFMSYHLASLAAFHRVAKELIFSEDKMDAFTDSFYDELSTSGIPQKIIENSKSYGEEVALHILAWADKDNYKESRSFSKFTITEKRSEWKPTPPSYMEGIEPHWRSIRPMVLDSAQQFQPLPPSEFSTEKNSVFYKETMEVYNAVKKASEEQKAIASFWDCNPYVMNQTGHMMFASKKITPGGHWMGISNIAAEKAGLNFAATIKVATMVSIGLFDAFISCWDEKYNSNLIRPETVINEYIDEEWVPLLQTPPFPEHTSGHSVVSTTSAIILSSLIGDPFSYTDDVEVKYGLPSRKFESFKQASQEAAISRLYGGIHYMPAITEGVKQGTQVGELIVKRIIKDKKIQ